MKKRLLIIPARKGSKRIINKNIKKFCGKPIIEYSIETAIKSKLFSKIHISTNNNEIKKIIKKYPIQIDFLRPDKYSGDKIGLMKVIHFVTKKFISLGQKFDEIWYLTPCSPLINHNDLIKASIFFKNVKKGLMLAVSDYSPPIQWAMEENNSVLKQISKKYFKKRSQDLKKRYYDTGTFGAFKASDLYAKKLTLTGFKLPKFKGIDIDTKEDWILAEKIYKSTK